MQLSALFIQEHFFTLKGNPILVITLHLPLLTALRNHNLLSTFMDLPSLNIAYKWNHFMSDFFHSA